MKAVEFDEANVKIAKNQPQYKTLPSYVDEEIGTVTSCFELDDEEIKQVRRTKKIWLTMMTFNKPMQPIRLSCRNPFRETEKIPIEEGFKLFNTTTTRLGFRDRLKVLFGAKIMTNLTITVDGEVTIKETEVQTSIIPKHWTPKTVDMAISLNDEK